MESGAAGAAAPSPSSAGNAATNAAAAAAALQRFGLVGRRALVTGATKGIGRAIVDELCALGAEVVLCARSSDDLTATLAELKAAGHRVHGMVADVSDSEQCGWLVNAASDAFGGRLDILVNNVGTNIRKPVVQYSPDELDLVLATNLKSAFRLSQLCHPLLKAGAEERAAAGDAAGSCVVFNSSVAGGPLAMFSGAPYAMSKAALNQLTKILAVEWARDGVRANAVLPWYTATPLANQVLADEAFKAKVLAATPLGRVATPADVAGAVAYLVGPAAGYVTGQCLAVDGGHSVKGFWP